MLDIGWQELFFIGVIALLVVGPKDLPRTLGAVARVYRKARGMAGEFQSGISEMVREAELDDIKRNVEKAGSFDMEKELKKTVDPTGTLTDDFDPEEFNRQLKKRVEGGPSERRIESQTTRPPESESEREPAVAVPAPAKTTREGGDAPPRTGESGESARIRAANHKPANHANERRAKMTGTVGGDARAGP